MATRWQDPLQKQPSACGLLSSGKEKQHWVIIIRQRTWNGKEFVSWMVDLSEFSSLLDMLSLWTCMSSYKGTTKGQHFLFKLFFFCFTRKWHFKEKSNLLAHYWISRLTKMIYSEPPKKQLLYKYVKKNKIWQRQNKSMTHP